MRAVGESCQRCPETAPCDNRSAAQGWTLANLELRPNHWRLSNLTLDIRKCDASGDVSRSACLGGASVAEYCKPRNWDPKCSVCVDPAHHLAAGQCQPCAVSGGDATLVLMAEAHGATSRCSGGVGTNTRLGGGGGTACSNIRSRRASGCWLRPRHAWATSRWCCRCRRSSAYASFLSWYERLVQPCRSTSRASTGSLLSGCRPRASAA